MTDPSPDRTQPATGRTRGLRRGAVLALCAALVLALTATLLLSASLSLPQAREDIEARLSRLAGAPVHIDGRAEFELLPSPRLSLTDLRATLADGDRALELDIDRAEVRFDLLAALLGRVEIRRLTLIRPDLGPLEGAPDAAAVPPVASAPPAAPPSGVLAPETEPSSRALRAFLVRFQGLNELEIRDGVLDLPGLRGPVSNLSLVLGAPDPQGPAALNASAVWNGQPATVDLRLAAPLPFFEGTPGALSFAMVSPMLEAAFEGTGAGGASPELDGSLRLSTPSLSRALRWLGDAPITTPDFGAFAIDTRVRLMGDAVALDTAAMDFGGNSSRGALEAKLFADRPPLLSGTLAFSRIDLGSLASAVVPRPRSVVDLQRPFRTGFLHSLDLDLRLSAEQARFGEVEARELAAALRTSGGEGALDIGDMALLGGRGQARVHLTGAPGAQQVAVAATLRGIQVAGLSALAPEGFPLAAGTGTLDLTLDGPSGSWSALMGGGRSHLALRVADGALAGFGREILRTAGRHELAFVERAGQTPFAALSMDATGGGTRLAVTDLAIDLGTATLEAAGTLDAADGGLSLRGRYRPAALEASGDPAAFTTSKPVGLKLDGEWPSPVLTVGSADMPM